MTYDLHGQWDYGNQYSDPGCPTGNCLRSHVNLTETINALSMITKAGVPSNKIVVGVSSYGRSFQVSVVSHIPSFSLSFGNREAPSAPQTYTWCWFNFSALNLVQRRNTNSEKMTTAGCTGPMCTYTGPSSGAQPAPCTNTAGYIANAEITMMVNVNNPGLTQFYDAASDSNILVYNSNQWVAYMSDATKLNRTNLYLGYHFAGTSDWAVDLQKQYPPTSSTPASSPDLDAYGAVDPVIQYCGEADSPNAQTVKQAWIDAGTLAKLQ